MKKQLPELGELKPDAGEGNTEAMVTLKAQKRTFTGEFNFSQGKLVSYGFSSVKLTYAGATTLLSQAVSELEALLGPSNRIITLPGESDSSGDS